MHLIINWELLCFHYLLERGVPSGGLYTVKQIHLIAPNFRAAQFSQIGVFKNFVETIFADQGFR